MLGLMRCRMSWMRRTITPTIWLSVWWELLSGFTGVSGLQSSPFWVLNFLIET